MVSFIEATQIVIFISYLILSIIVLHLYVKFYSKIDQIKYSLLFILTSSFLVLCALTHLSYVWGGHGKEVLLYLCALVSITTAVVTIFSINEIEEIMSNRFKARSLIKDDMILDLMNGYHINLKIKDYKVLSGTVNGTDLLNPNAIEINQRLSVGTLLNLFNRKYQIIHKIKSIQEYDLENQNGDQVFNLLGIDVTDEKENENNTLAIYLSTAHEIKTPLTSISYLYDEIITNNSSIDKETSLELSTHLEMLSMLANQMLDAGRFLEGQVLKPSLDVFDLEYFIVKMKNISYYLHDENINFIFEIDKNNHNSIKTDEEWIWQIYLNFISNAIKHTTFGFIKTILIVESNELTLKVIDSGDGKYSFIDNNVFNVFKNKNYNIHQIKENYYKGVGLGLFTVSKKIKALNGTCKAYSNESSGSTFEIKIPIQISEIKEFKESKNKSFLVVDDTISILRIMQKFLDGNNVETAKNGKIALELMLKNEYDIVFMDLSMPIMGGLECTHKFRKFESGSKRKRRQKIIMMSATEIERKDLFDDKLSKPFNIKKLNNLILKS